MMKRKEPQKLAQIPAEFFNDETKYYALKSAVAQLVEALRYKLKGRGFDSRWGY
jgi:hypothetical protein